MKDYKIALLAGDGIGPEISKVTQRVLLVLANKHDLIFNFDEKCFGGSAIESTGNPLPEDTLKTCKDSDAVLLAAIGNPKFDSLPRESRPETGLLSLRL